MKIRVAESELTQQYYDWGAKRYAFAETEDGRVLQEFDFPLPVLRAYIWKLWHQLKGIPDADL